MASIQHRPIALADRWSRRPGHYDVTHGAIEFPTDGSGWGIPMVRRGAPMPTALQGFRPSCSTPPTPGTAVHCFQDDRRFESLWIYPDRALQYLGRFASCITPDFSVRTGLSLAIHAYQVYRNRWMGAWWQQHGLLVIPSIVWGDLTRWDLWFAGIEPSSIVAVSAVGLANDDELARMFRVGVQELVDQIKPAGLVCYGNPLLLPPIPSDLEVRSFPHQPWPGAKPSGIPRAWRFIRDDRNRFTILDVETRKVLRANLTINGLRRTLLAWYPTPAVDHMIEQGGTVAEADDGQG